MKLLKFENFCGKKAEASEAKLQSVRTQAELELPATNATCTMAAFVSLAGALIRKKPLIATILMVSLCLL